MDDPVLFDVDGEGVATITLNRPDRLNAINLQMRDLLWTYFGACAEIPGLRALVFRGKGRAFSAGADISEFGTAPSVMEARRARHDRDLWWELLNLPVPTVALMHGFCFGAGLELPLLCDYRAAESGTRFGLPEVTLGYIPSACGTQTLPRTISPAAAAGMILTGEPVESARALEWGLIHQVVEPSGLDDALAEVLASLDSDDAIAAFQARRRGMLTAGLPAR